DKPDAPWLENDEPRICGSCILAPRALEHAQRIHPRGHVRRTKSSRALVSRRLSLIQARFAPGTSRRAFGRLLGFSAATAQNWFSGRCSVPNRASLEEGLRRLPG